MMRRGMGKALTKECGHAVASLPLDMRQRGCPACGAVLVQDVHAAQHLKDAGCAAVAAGLAASTCGGDARPARKRVGGPRRSRKPR